MSQDVSVTIADHIATVEICRPPNNFFDVALIAALVDAFETIDENDDVRVSVLCSQGKHFCAGADFTGEGGSNTPALYEAAIRIFSCRKPIVAVVQGAAIGGGFGLALAADFRFAAPEATFSANFARLGFHQGFGLSVTLPELVGQQVSRDLLFTGRRVKGKEALHMGLCDRLFPLEEVRGEALAYAAEIAASAPLAVEAIRKTLRGNLADRVQAATAHEAIVQAELQETNDFAEGTASVAARRPGNFTRS